MDDRILSVRISARSGSYTAVQALEKLLENSGITYRFTSAGDVLLELKHALSSIDVTANVDSLSNTLIPRLSSHGSHPTLISAGIESNCIPHLRHVLSFVSLQNLF